MDKDKELDSKMRMSWSIPPEGFERYEGVDVRLDGLSQMLNSVRENEGISSGNCYISHIGDEILICKIMFRKKLERAW